MLEVRQQAYIGVREWGALAAELEVVDLGWGVRAADDVEPLLDLALVLELSAGARTRGCEELIEVELVELALAGDRKQLIGHLVREQAHLRESPIRVPLGRLLVCELFLGSLFIGVRPVEDLLFDELACGQRPEWCAREVEVGLGGDREERALWFRQLGEVLIDLFQAGRVLEPRLFLGDSVVLALEQLLCCLAPRAEVVLIEDDKVTVDGVEPFVLRLDVAESVSTEEEER